MSQNKKNGAYILGNHRIYFMQIYAINEKRCQINFSHDIIVDFVAFKKERNHFIQSSCVSICYKLQLDQTDHWLSIVVKWNIPTSELNNTSKWITVNQASSSLITFIKPMKNISYVFAETLSLFNYIVKSSNELKNHVIIMKCSSNNLTFELKGYFSWIISFYI